MYINEKAEAWLQALESGEYEQCKGVLRLDGRYCCLGVACEINNLFISGTTAQYGPSDHHSKLPGTFHEVLGLVNASGRPRMYSDVGDSLVNLNDHRGYTFTMIAKHLRDNPEKYFRFQISKGEMMSIQRVLSQLADDEDVSQYQGEASEYVKDQSFLISVEFAEFILEARKYLKPAESMK